MSLIYFSIVVLTVSTKVCSAEIFLTQTPESLSVQLGESATISCKASAAIDDDLAWHHQKPGETPKFIINFASSMSSGRYQGSGYDYDFSLTISNVQAEDSGVYYCQHHEAFPYTFGGGTKLIIKTGVSVPPSVSLLPPSAEQLAAGEATVVCVLTGYTPQGASVSWAVDGSGVAEGFLTGEEVQTDGGKFARSSTLTLTKEEWLKGDLYACKVSHDGSQRSAELRRTQCISQ